MKKRILLIILSIIVIGYFSRIFWQPGFKNQGRDEMATNRSSKASSSLPQDYSNPRIHRTEPQKSERSGEISRDKARERVDDEWRAPIAFYGRVIDEDGEAVEGVNIVFGLNNLNGHSERTALSDSSGLFSLQNEQGKHLSISISKAGYYTSVSNQTSFFYAGENTNFVPDRNNPVIFRLRKKQASEPLIAVEFPGFGKIEKLPREGEPVELDLIKGVKAQGNTGHIKIEFWSTPVPRNAQKFDWKYRISVPNGGILESEEEFNFTAPEEGYKPFTEIEMLASSNEWKIRTRKKYFIRLSSGKYGRIDFYLLAKNGVFEVHSVVNPSGSRNLEFNPDVQPRQTVFE